MKYLIVSIYDSGYGFSVCDNGKYIPKFKVTKASCEEYKWYYELIEPVFYYKLKKKYSDYDLIIVCEDGEVEVLVDKINGETKS